MVHNPNRRQFLGLAGAGAAVSVAGCSDLQSTQNGGDADGSLTAVVEPSSEQIQELEDAVDSGEMDQMEAQQEFQQLVEETVSAFEDEAEANGLSIENSESEIGLFLIDGEPAALIEALQTGDVSQLMPEAMFEDILEQQAQQQEQQQQQQEGAEEEPSQEEIEEQLEEQLEEQAEAEQEE